MQESLLAALALVLVVEGLLPLFAPRVWRDSFRRLLDLSETNVKVRVHRARLKLKALMAEGEA